MTKAITTPSESTSIGNGKLLSTWDILRHQAKVLVDSGLLPKTIDTWQKATAIIMYGQELGMGPMEAIQSIDVIQGKPTQKPQSMKAMVHKRLPSAVFRQVKSTDDESVFEAARPGDVPAQFSFTIKDAERLGLLSKDNWKKQPKTMLNWRCVGHVSRTVFPDCLSGVSYTPEELGAVVDEDHNIIEVPSAPAAVVDTTFDVNDAQQAENLQALLVKHKIPEKYWPDIASELHGQDKKAVFSIIKRLVL